MVKSVTKFSNSQKEILKKIQSLQTKLEQWNREYYVDSSPSVSDEVYDFHYQELKKLEEKHADLLSDNLQTTKIGFLTNNPLFQKIVHKYKMYSINNAFSNTDLDKFFTRVEKVAKEKTSYMIQPKIDGLSLSLIFKNHKFHYGATRGNGITGENITQNILAIPQFQKLLLSRFFLDNFELRGEAFINKNNFQAINQKLIKKRKEILISFYETFEKKCEQRTKVMKLNWTKFTGKIDPKALSTTSSLDKWLLLASSSLQKVPLKFKVFGKNQDHLKLFGDWILVNTKNSSFEIIQEKDYWIADFTLMFRFPHQLYMNPRNLTSGTLRQLDSNVVSERNIEAIFYDIFLPTKPSITMKQKMKIIEKLNFPTPNQTFFSDQKEAIKSKITKLTNEREFFPYETDGVVIKVNEEKYYSALGHTEKYQHNAIAYKFPASQITTKINNIFPTVGRTGKITYNAELEPAFLAGTTIAAANLHNPDFIAKLDLRIGDTVVIQKAGDIIPQVIKVLPAQRPIKAKKWKPDTKCPSCRSLLVQPSQSAFQFCPNQKCQERKIQSLIYFVSLKGINIEGLSEGKIRFLVRNKFISQPYDFFQLKDKQEALIKTAREDELSTLGYKSIQNLLDEIEKSRNFTWPQLLTSSNILHVGETTAQVIAAHYSTPQLLKKASLEDLENIDQIGPIVARSVFNFFSNPSHYKMLKNVYNLKNTNKALTFQTKETIDVNSFWFGKIIVITGKLDQPRRSIIEVLLGLGANVKKIVSSKVDICIVGEDPSSKLEKAKQHGLKILYFKKVSEIIKFEKKS